MRSITQNIVLDRLQQALVSRGVTLKRHTVLEVAAETFGFLDGNAFVAAMKEGRFDPPVAEHLGTALHAGRKLALLRDPITTSVYALEMQALPPATKDVRLAMSPYGGLLRLPDTDCVDLATSDQGGTTTEETRIGTRMVDDGRTAFTLDRKGPSDQKGKVVYVIDNQGGSNDPEVAEWRHLLSEENDITVDCAPVQWADAWRMARVDGKLYFAITAGEEYDGHDQAVMALRSFQAYVDDKAQPIRRLGGIIQCHDDVFFGRIELEVLLPVELARDVDGIDDWHEAIAILLGAENDGVVATFGPQVWVKDNAMDTHPGGDTRFDVSVEVLLMGSKAAREIEDSRDSSDDLQMAIFAPDWIRDWKGPFYIQVADEIAQYLEGRADMNGGAETANEEDDENEDDRPKDAVCDDCDGTIDYDTGICPGCNRDWSKDGESVIDEGILATVLPEDSDHLKRQSDIGDPV